jgi:hypothetical protein
MCYPTGSKKDFNIKDAVSEQQLQDAQKNVNEAVNNYERILQQQTTQP